MFNFSSALETAFPSYLQEDIHFITQKILLEPELPTSYHNFELSLGKDTLCIPYRQYFPTVYNNSNNPYEKLLSNQQKSIIDCFFTRHHNGYIRENCLRQIIHCQLDWVAPFVLQLLGEYVIEILNVIYQNLDDLEIPLYLEFIKNNPKFYNLTKNRLASYWNCYHRQLYKYLKDYVGFKIINFFDNHL